MYKSNLGELLIKGEEIEWVMIDKKMGRIFLKKGGSLQWEFKNHRPSNDEIEVRDDNNIVR